MDKIKIGNIIEGLVIALVLIFLVINNTSNEYLECQSEVAYCKNVTKNMLNMRNESLLFKPKDVKDVEIKQYEVSVTETEGYGENQRKERHNEPRFSVNFVNKFGNTRTIFNGYHSEDQAKAKKDEILTCINGKNYPCIIDNK